MTTARITIRVVSFLTVAAIGCSSAAPEDENADSVDSAVTLDKSRLCLVDVNGPCAGSAQYSNLHGVDVYGVSLLNAGSDPAVCRQRAYDYFEFCGRRTPVSTTFTGTGTVTRGDGICRIQVSGNCVGAPQFTNLDTNDVYPQPRNVLPQPGLCANRAQDYFNVCGGSAVVTSTFGPTGARTQVGCAVTVYGACAGSSQFTNYSGPDYYGQQLMQAGNYESVCADRAAQYHAFCNAPVTTTYLRTGRTTSAF